MRDYTSINLRNDIVFKFVFGYEKNEKILIALLNAILHPDGEKKIVKLTFLNSINLKEYLKDKISVLDVKAEDSKGRRYNVEVQVKAEQSYIERVIYYLAKLFTEQLQQGDDYNKLNKTISISILNFILLEEETDLHNIYRFLNIKSKKELTELKEIHFIELPKFKKDKPKRLRTKFEKWLHILKFGENYAKDPDNLPEELREEEFIMAIQEMVRASSDEVVRELIEARSKALHDEATRMKHAVEKAKKEGREEGKKKRDIEITKNLLKIGISLEQISKATGLSIEEINNINQ